MVMSRVRITVDERMRSRPVADRDEEMAREMLTCTCGHADAIAYGAHDFTCEARGRQAFAAALRAARADGEAAGRAAALAEAAQVCEVNPRCRHVDHVQHFCGCWDAAEQIRALAPSPAGSAPDAAAAER
jgi:hypothetical protein